MQRLFDTLAHEHSHGLVVVAATVCLIGSILSVLLMRRVLTSSGRRRALQMTLAALITGATVWSTHFIAMLSYDPGVAHGYEPVWTGISLLIVVAGAGLAMLLLVYSGRLWMTILAGTIFGLSISTMHFVGMSAYQTAGRVMWDVPLVTASTVLSMVLGAIALHRVRFPVTRVCWMGGVAGMVLAIVITHFTGMAAFSVTSDLFASVPPQVLPDTAIAVLIIAVMALILVVGFMSFGIESNLELESRDEIERAALLDHLTGLPNRTSLTRKMAELDEDQPTKKAARRVILSLDLNLFKQINNLYGHTAGDAVLQEVAVRLHGALEEDEYLARTGGDEFVALAWNVADPCEALAFAERLNAVLDEPVIMGAITLSVTMTIGVAIDDEDCPDLGTLLHRSELALFHGKNRPDDPVSLYSQNIENIALNKARLQNDLRDAIAEDQFHLVFQVQNEIETLAPVGFEALLRWNHPESGNVPPDRFIPVAEESGLIVPIGRWVLESACAEAATWDQPYSIAVNVAPQQLIHPGFVDDVARSLSQSGLPPARLELELTEASLIDDQLGTLRTMKRLKAMGVRLAMDDFGTGYSSLSTLQTFPFDKIKIDRSFVRDVHSNSQRAAIVRSTLLLGAALDIPVLAEGVEVEEELRFLQSEQCASVQGFLFGRPLDRDALHKMLASQPQMRAAV